MQLTWQQSHHPHHIITADKHGIVIGETRHQTSLLLSDSLLITDWPVTNSQLLGLDKLQPVLADLPEVLLLGTGVQQIFPDMLLLQSLLAKGVGVEVMDTLAACRTFNVLLDEKRKVAAALIWDN